MRQFIKIISVVLIASVLISSYAFASDNISISSDSDNVAYMKLKDVLTSLGVITEDDTFVDEYTRDITEDEFNKLVTNVLGFEYSEKCDGTFGFNRAVQKLVNIMGYDVKVRTIGPYPIGETVVATQLDLFDGLTQKGDKPFSIAEAMMLIFNSLHVELMEQTTYGDNVKYEIGDRTLLSQYKHIYFVTGIMTDNSITNLYAESSLKEGNIKIDNAIYNVDNSKYIDLIGKKIDAYYREDENDDKHIVYAENALKDADITIVKSDDIDDCRNHLFTYYQEDKKKEINISPSSIIIYNNIALNKYDEALFKPINGGVEFIDNDSNGIYDVVSIKSYYNMVVSSVNVIDMEIKDIEDKNKTISLLDLEDRYIVKTTKGEVVDFDYLESYDVLSVAESKDKNFVEIIVSNKFASGDVNSTQLTNSSKIVVIDNKEYNVDIGYTNAANIIKAGMYGTALLDFEGDIVFFVDESENEKYGYIIAGATTNGLDSKIMLKLLTQNDEIVVYHCNENVTIDGETVKGYNNIEDKLSETVTITKNAAGNSISAYTTERYKQQLVRYKLNSDGKIRVIDTVKKSAKEYDDQNHLRCYRKAVSGVYTSDAKSINADVLLTTKTNIFIVAPTADDKENINDEKHFKVRKIGVLKHGYSQATYDAYTIDKECVYAETLVTTTDITSTASYSGSTPAYLIQEIHKALNEDGDIVDLIVAIKNTGEIELMVESDTTLDIAPGDICRIELNEKGEAVAATLVYRKGGSFVAKGNFYSSFYSVTGLVYNYAKDVIQITTKNEDDLALNEIPADIKNFNDSGAVYYWDETREKFYAADSSTIDDFKHDGAPDTVTVIANNGKTVMIVIF